MERHFVDQHLANVPLFADLDRKELEEISSLATETQVKAGKVLTQQGAHGNEFIVILEGEAEVVRDGDLLATIGPGTYFGEIALLSERPRGATVTAKTDMSIAVINRREFSTMLADAPEVSTKLLATMADRLAVYEREHH